MDEGCRAGGLAFDMFSLCGRRVAEGPIGDIPIPGFVRCLRGSYCREPGGICGLEPGRIGRIDPGGYIRCPRPGGNCCCGPGGRC